MPDIKIKPEMNAPKLRQTGAAPKEAAGLLRQQYEEKQAERQPGAKSPVQYATDKVETDGRRGAALAADKTRRTARQVKRRDGRKEKPTDTEPEKESAAAQGEQPQAAERPAQAAPRQPDRAPKQTGRGQDTQRRPLQERQVTPKTRQSAAVRERADTAADISPPPPHERGRQKFIQDTIQTRQETRRAIDGEISRVDGAASAERKMVGNVERGGTEQPSLMFHRENGGTAAHRATYRVEKPGKAGGKVDLPRKPGSRAPMKPTFAPKERAVVGRQIQAQAMTAAQRARRAGQQKLQRQMVKQSAETAKKTAKRTAQATVKAAQAVAGAVKAAVSSVAALGGGAVLLVVLIVVALIAAIAASPFGIFFSGDSASADTVPVSAAVAQVNYDFNARLEELQGADAYDDVTVNGSTADWPDMLAVFAAKVAGSDSPDAADVATIDADRIDRLKTVFWDMNAITSEVETIDHPDSDPDDETDDSWTEKILHITLTPKAAADMPSVYGFTTRQTDAMNELLAERAALAELLGSLVAFSADAAEIMKRLPADLSPERREVVKVACSLVGKVTYFWGGKSLVIGWDSRWGQLQKVWADGSSTTGTYRPYGLDCSGFVDWTFYNATGGAYYPGHGGGASMQHNYCMPISWADALPGDLVFYPGDEHVGIVGGRDADGNLLIIHCASSANGTVVTGASGFTFIGRPLYYAE